ncbi:hypothetical protein MIND_00249200 [Mycena indigotica]|uniref:C2H2-type domain-containing protein n=1 Tax=Mycena indigotica TaxID=2126181 RepID=A0A8H6WDC8_9AGAR|nr:uncharacterized protein MIND_00249200 [Mycena indigotica]KAF7312361.1 hypothetical protein MIND_00249200 [Mycena indigotica]
MVFGLFGRKQEPKPQPTLVEPIQLRTPSPSVLSGSSPQAHDLSPSVPLDADTLKALIQSVPAQSFRQYTLAHLATASPQLVSHIAEFFSALEVPPTLHCVRCHKGYFSVENNERSCLVAHDDESAEVEGHGSNQETLWNCCGKTVEGDGSEGPPEGWCFEGAHTTDLKRARFRADSTVHNDKLVSCARRRCHEPLGSRKRSRRAIAENSDTESDSDDDGASHSSIRTRSRASKRARTVREDDTDVEEDVEMPLHSSPKPKRKPRAKSVVSTASTSVKPKSTKKSVVISSDPPTPSRKSKKPPSTRFVPVAAASLTSTSSVLSVNGSAGIQSQSQSQTVQIVVAPKPAKAPAKRTMKPKQKKLSEVVESSIVGEI